MKVFQDRISKQFEIFKVKYFILRVCIQRTKCFVSWWVAKLSVSCCVMSETVTCGVWRHASGDSVAVDETTASSSSQQQLLRSHSSLSLRGAATSIDTSLPYISDDRLTVLVQMFWISVSLLESDFEYEFLLAVRLLDKVFRCCVLLNLSDMYICIYAMRWFDGVLSTICW